MTLVPHAADAVGRVGLIIIQLMTVGGLIAAAAGIIQVLRRHMVVAAEVWFITTTGTLVPRAADAVGRVGHITVQATTAVIRIAAVHHPVITQVQVKVVPTVHHAAV